MYTGQVNRAHLMYFYRQSMVNHKIVNAPLDHQVECSAWVEYQEAITPRAMTQGTSLRLLGRVFFFGNNLKHIAEAAMSSGTFEGMS